MSGPALHAPTWRTYWPVAVGLAALYVPVYQGLGNHQGLDDGIAPPLIAAMAAWLAWRAWPNLSAVRVQPAVWAGSLALGLGLVLYVLGRILDFSAADIGSQIPVLAGVTLLGFGWAGLRAVAFPVGFLAFMVPVPGAVVVELTGPLRQWGAQLSTMVLRLVDYPVAIDGTIVSIGRYVLLVNEACSGLGSMFSLAAAGLLYIHLAGDRRRLHMALLLAAILPIAFLANTLRILTLTLVTYHAGDRLAQGPAHEATGVMLFVVALAMMFALDAFLSRRFEKR